MFSVVRRLIAGRVSLGVEYDLRNRMYRHLQSLELASSTSQQTGQLMSRSTVDLQAVRFFLGYGLIFMLQSLVTIVVAAAVMLALNLELGAAGARARAVRDLGGLALRAPEPAGVPGGAAADRRADRRGRGERVGGVRVVKAFAREERQLRPLRPRGARACSTSRWSRPGCAPSTTPSSASCPKLGLAGVLLVGGRQAIDGRSPSASSWRSTAT